MESLLESWGVFLGSRPLQAASPRTMNNYPGAMGAGVEAFEENRINEQALAYVDSHDTGTRAPGRDELSRLPGGAQYDYLLETGRSAELLGAMASIFRNDPPVNCGANQDLVGMSCDYKEEYSRQVFSPAAVARHLQLASTFWNAKPTGNVQKLTVANGSRLIIVGDVHGQLEDVLWMFFKYGPPSATRTYLFNGDIVDRGGHALEILLLLFAFKRDMMNSIYLQRGNHEDVQCGIHFGFRAELQSKFGELYGGTIWNVCGNLVFPLMPLVSTVHGPLTGGRRFCVLHGGVPVDCPGQTRAVSLDEDLLQIDRVRPTIQAVKDQAGHLLFNLLWADPADSADGKRLGHHGRGNRFLERDVVDFCERNGLAFIVRSHEVPRSLRGAVATHNGKTFTIFSASNYMGSAGNRGGVFICDVNKGLQLREHMAPTWPQLADFYQRFWGSGNDAEQARCVDDFESQYQIARSEDTGGGGGGGGPASKPTEAPSPRSAPPMPPNARQNAEQQQLQFVMERICEHKDQLFTNFRDTDADFSGVIPRKKWAEVMLAQLQPVCPEVLTPHLLERLANVWDIGDPVGYVRFLHRFQIRGAEESTRAPDLMREVSKLRKQLLDAPAQSLEQLLDPNGDRTVSAAEFANFLPQFHVDVPPEHAGALYETMAQFMKQDPLTLDSTILCIALMSRDPVPVSMWSPVAERIGTEIARAGKSYAYAFKYWDTDHDGYLSLEELQCGLQQLPATQQLEQRDVVGFMSFIEDTGISNDRVNILEFIRAVAPRGLAMELHQMMLKELLKRVWICRPALQTLLAHFDPGATNRVTVKQFKSCMGEINAQLEQRGRPLLTQAQIASICEIASGGCSAVDYDRFIHGLHIIDIGRSS
mmetsp:Transcript_45605/g.117926  ORF Transcript_45605/g.117926 Transcript_45605/m.117926 type:complete len:874 (+) Transcript_45605:113-2734(+)